MRILNILHVPMLAGTEEAFISICGQMVQGGNEVFGLIPINAKSKDKLSSINGLQILENNKAYKNFGKFDIFYMFYLKKIIKKHKIDLVVTNNGRNTEILQIVLQGRLPLVAINHGTNAKKTAKADYLLAITSNMAKAHAEAGMDKNRIFKFANMINIEQGDVVTKNDNIVPVIGSIGRFADQKGFDILLPALKILKDKGLEFKCIIGGDGEDREKLNSQRKELGLEGLIEFSGWVNDKKAYYERMDIFVLSSRYEPFGIVLLEAMKYKTPIVATDCDGPLDIITDGENGLLVKRFNVGSLAAGLERLLLDKELRNKLAENGYKNLLENYTNEIVGKRLNETLLMIKADFENRKHNIQ